MAFRKTADAQIIQPVISIGGWQSVPSRRRVASSGNLISQASEIFGKAFNPEDYLLTHCTIVASVDVEKPSSKARRKLGKLEENGQVVNRKYSDYYIKSDSESLINNNGDSWSREVLLKSYPSFVGSMNYLEHVQIPELSKGRIIDAVARDVGNSVYIDILVATARSNEDLVRQIESGDLSTLSMGCFLPGTQVTMADGTRVAIEDVHLGDMVLTHKGRAREVKNKQILNGVWNMRRVSVRGISDPITSTDNHPFYVYRPATDCACGCGEPLDARRHKSPRRRMSARFKVGHDKRVLNPNNTYSLDEFRERRDHMDEIQSMKLEKVRADELQVGDYVVFPRAAWGDTEISCGKARLLGYFLAEGSFLKRKGEPVEVQFNFSLKEKDTYVSEVVDLLRAEFPEANEPWVQDRPDRNTSTVHVSGREISAWFKRLGGEYSNQKKLHSEVLCWSTEAHRHLVGAWLNGDGCLTQNGSTCGTTTSYDLACQMQTIMVRLGLPVWMECKVGARTVEILEIVNGGLIERDLETGRLPHFNLLFGKMHSKILAGACGKIETSNFKSDLRVNEDYIMYPITSIEATSYEGQVYDMEVDEDHTYIADGMSVSNCTVDFTICTKCGNVAHDETDMCTHILYEKGNTFYDESGNPRKIAELCGHSTIEPDGGVQFIEASWVGTPAFQGAILRNILTADKVSPETLKKAREVLSTPPVQWSNHDQVRVAKRFQNPTHTRIAFDFSEDEEGGDEEPKEKEEDSNPLDGLSDEVKKFVMERARKEIRDDLTKKRKEDLLGPEMSSTAPNDSLIKQAKTRKFAYQAGIASIRGTSSSEKEVLRRLKSLNEAFGLRVPNRIYRAASMVGTASRYPDLVTFLGACRRTLGRMPTQPEARTLIRIAKVLSAIHPTGA